MADCCLIKKVATVEVYENKNEVRAYGFMAGDRNTPVMEVRFKHLWGESNLSSCKLRWIIVDDVGSLLVGEVPIQSDNTALINLPNELFTGDRRMKVQLTVASCDGERILNLQQFTDLKVINSLAPNEVVEPVYQILINAIYDESQKYLKELETSYTQKYGSLDSLYKNARASLEQYLITAENGGNAEFLQGYSPAHFQKVENTISDLIASTKYKVGDIVEVLGYYTKGDGAGHPRIKKPVGYNGADAVIGADGSIWGIVHSGEVNVSWFGAKGDGVTHFDFQKIIDYGANILFPNGVFLSNAGIIIQDNTLRTIKGTGNTIINFNIQNGYAITNHSYYTRALSIEGIEFLNPNQNNTSVFLKNALSNNVWGSGIVMKDCNVSTFYLGVMELVENFTSDFYNCKFSCRITNDPVDVGTIIRTKKTIDFGSNLRFVNCSVFGARIGLHLENSVISLFTNCTFENLKLFEYCPVFEDDTTRNYQLFQGCWFEKIQNGILNSESDLNTFAPIKTLPRNDVKNIKMISNYNGGRTPQNFLNEIIEPIRYKSFTLVGGYTDINEYTSRRKTYNYDDTNIPIDDQNERAINLALNLSDVSFDTIYETSVITFIIKVIGYNDNVMTVKYITTTYDEGADIVGTIRDNGNIGLGNKFTITKQFNSANVNVNCHGKGIRNAEVIVINS